MPVDGPFVSPHNSPLTFTSFSDILNWTLAAFKAVDEIPFLTLFQGVLGSNQSNAESLHGFIRDRYAMSAMLRAYIPLLTAKIHAETSVR